MDNWFAQGSAAAQFDLRPLSATDFPAITYEKSWVEMSKILACVNLKGGVGKTALAVNFSAYCGSKRKKTLLIDLDPQTNATFCCIDVDVWKKHAAKKGTVADLLGVRRHANAEGKVKTVKEVIKTNVFPGVDLIPSHLDLFTVDLDLAGETCRETKLRRSLQSVLDDYEIIVCDCPPNLTIPTQNALAISSHYVVPISPDYLSGLGVGLLLNRVEELMGALEHPLEHIGIVISRVGRRAQHKELTVAALRQTFGDLVLIPELAERVTVSESAEEKKPIYDMSNAQASAEFRAVSKELLKRMGVG